MILVFSDEQYESKKDPVNKVLRGFMHLGGWLLENINENQTRATLLIEVDLKGGIPEYIQKNTNTIQAAQLNKITKSIDKYLADLKK